MAAEDDPVSTRRRIRVTEEELEQSSDILKAKKQDSDGKPSRCSRGDGEAEHSLAVSPNRPNENHSQETNDGPTCEKGRNDRNSLRRLDRGENDGFNVERASSRVAPDAAKCMEDLKGKARKVRRGYEVYTVKKGKFSEKVTINESEFLPAQKEKHEKEKENIVRSDGNRRSQDFNSKEFPGAVRDKMFTRFDDEANRRAIDTHAVQKYEDWDQERRKSAQSNSRGGNVSIANDEEVWDVEDTTQKEDKIVAGEQKTGKATGVPKEQIAEKPMGRGMGRGRRGKALQPQSNPVGRKDQRSEKDDTYNKQNQQQKWTYKNLEKEKHVATTNKHGKLSNENITGDGKRRVTFSEGGNAVIDNEGSTKSDLSNDDANKAAGILVLPSPIKEKDNLIGKDTPLTRSSPLKQSRRSPQKESGFFKLERPVDFNPNRPRGDAKFTSDIKAAKETKSVPLVRKGDMIISSSDNEIWKKINSDGSKMKKLLAGGLSSMEDFERILELSALLQDLYKELIVKHLEFSFRNDVEGSLWKNTFHNIITTFRLFLDEYQTSSFVNDAFQFYWNFLQDGDDFLQDLLKLLQEECKFDLQSFVDNPLKMAGCKKQVKFGIRSCHLILLNLGDLERYITDLQQDANYNKANKNYLKAQALAPKNGKSYNQLAIVAVKTKKKMDAIYYYIRSLEASNPIESARERLTGIFHEIKRKADLTKKQKLEKSLGVVEAGKRSQMASEEDESYKSDYSREDIWVFYRAGKYFKAKIAANGRIQELSDANAKLEEVVDVAEKVSLREVNREFLIFYLYMHSKLYTRIGFEYIMTVYEDAIQPFKILLNHEKASSVKKTNLIKYIAINIFAVDNLFRKQDCTTDVMKDSPLDVAIIFGMDMSATLAERCLILLEKGERITLEQFLPAVHVWMKWMAGYLDLIKASSVCFMKDIWESFMKFLNGIRSFSVERVEAIQDGEPTGLFEDRFLSGFRPLMDMDNPSMKVSADLREKAEVFMRVESLKELAFMISDSHKVPVVFNDKCSSFEVAMPEEKAFDSPTKHKDTLHLDDAHSYDEDDDSDVVIEDVIEDVDDRELQQLRALKAKKLELTAQVHDQERRKKERAAIMESNASQVHIISENHPKYIVPDTNCFIDNLDGIMRIIDSRDFDIILPLIVVNELDGLKKGKEIQGGNSNAAFVKESARQAMQMLEAQFSASNGQIRAVTSAGTELETIAFRDEELSSDKGKNDDIILSCCLHYCEEATNRFTSGGGPLMVHRNVVLLTDDRNLRLKAHSRHVPTLSIKMFLKMAHLV